MDIFPYLFVALVLAHLVNRIYKYRLTRFNLDSFGTSVFGIIMSFHIEDKVVFNTVVFYSLHCPLLFSVDIFKVANVHNYRCVKCIQSKHLL